MFFVPLKPAAYEASGDKARRHWLSAIGEFMTYLTHIFGSHADDVCRHGDVAASTAWSEGDLDKLLATLRRPDQNDTDPAE